MRPRHGFVDSRLVTGIDEIKAVLAETRAADPEGEVLLMAPIEGQTSFVLTPTAVAVGQGTDGATAGCQGGLTLPLAAVAMPSREDLECAGVGGTPYIEAIWDGVDLWEVQLRDGPQTAAPSGGAYIPRDTVVTSLLEAGGDLLQWEQVVRDAPEGAVVLHRGGTPLSHYAVHAVLRGLAIVYDDRPIDIGDFLPATTAGTSPPDMAAFRRGVAQGFNVALGWSVTHTQAVHLLLLALHQQQALLGTPEGCQALGAGAALLVRLGVAAVMGEWRHVRPDWQGRPRTTVFAWVLDPGDYQRFSFLMGEAIHAFKHGKWAFGYGGEAWYKVGRAILDVSHASRMAYKGRKGSLSRLIREMNVCVHLAHNSGWWLNKFAAATVADEAARGERLHVYHAAHAARDVLASDPWEGIEAWVKAPEPKVASPGVDSAPPVEVEVGAGAESLVGKPLDGGVHIQYGHEGKYRRQDFYLPWVPASKARSLSPGSLTPYYQVIPQDQPEETRAAIQAWLAEKE